MNVDLKIITKIAAFSSNDKKSVVLPNLTLAIRPVGYCGVLPVAIPPERFEVWNGENADSTDHDFIPVGPTEAAAKLK